MYYKKIDHPKWQYVLTEDVEFFLDKHIPAVDHEYYQIIPHFTNSTTTVIVKEGYAWDGVTCPEWAKGMLDAKQFRKASLIHDVLLQAIYDDSTVSKRYLSYAHKVFRKQVAIDSNRLYAYTLYLGLAVGHDIWHKATS